MLRVDDSTRLNRCGNGRDRLVRPIGLSVRILLAVAALAGCSRPPASPGEAAASRAVIVTSTGCGHADGGLGSGILLEPDLVLTAAHVVIAGDGRAGVAVMSHGTDSSATHEPSGGDLDQLGGGSGRNDVDVNAVVVAIDRRRDLALIRTDKPVNEAIEARPRITTVASGAPVEMVGARSGASSGRVSRRTWIVTDGVRSPNRVKRLGYVVELRSATGDSGSGLFTTADEPADVDHDEPMLAGLVFAVSSGQSNRTWAVAGSEIGDFLDESNPAKVMTRARRFRCDPERSQLTMAVTPPPPASN